jgi:hypothetical protein
MRLAVDLSGRSASLLARARLDCDGKRLTLALDPDWSELFSESVERRLMQAADELGMSHGTVLEKP